ncbi:TrmH family RNA methyltransferase [Janthinobacterium agaricidamnosum]|uniref:SpoU rRNA Methylase family protein n=1 Tax=Janthinobacterium agaricidamnosum NBRC 102515 = DSM 9628 TaxID=1349767 RepID=W0V813_9BURK|nr:RNA methyltransferase [Janthinobacterium agaricidamnosum]CDG83417.1 spoU rRNA Methylase family protein [Janthinobacterium agaricidamnosum NBRC 102515 = DSM 9628]
MKLISSRDNALYKELKNLAGSSQARRKLGRSLLDGVHLCQSYLQLRGLPPQCIVSDSALRHPEVADIVARCEAGRVACIAMPDALYGALSQVEHGVGILFVIETPQRDVSAPLAQSAVLLDNLQDPGNVGSILRSAAAAGIKQVYCSGGTAFCWSPKVLRAAMGAHFVLDIFENVDLAALVRASGVAVLATSGYAEQRLYDVDLRQPVAWLLGHEGQGVADDLLALATHRVVIPHLGQVESLNVAACAAVCFFEQLRQNQS